jgi:hypothetical protein
MALYTNYDLNKDVSYTNNREYRKCLRELFNMNCIINEDLNDIDEETKDELLYDENTMSAIMDEIFNATKNNELFNELYDLAAARMFSTDRTIGQAVLLSYDYLCFFHNCLASFLRGNFDNKNEFYLLLKIKLT